MDTKRPTPKQIIIEMPKFRGGWGRAENCTLATIKTLLKNKNYKNYKIQKNKRNAKA